MNNATHFEDRASRSRSRHEGESSSSLCDRLSLLSHRLEVPLHPVDANRDAVDERERLGVFRQHRSEHTWNNASVTTISIIPDRDASD